MVWSREVLGPAGSHSCPFVSLFGLRQALALKMTSGAQGFLSGCGQVIRVCLGLVSGG